MKQNCDCDWALHLHIGLIYLQRHSFFLAKYNLPSDALAVLAPSFTAVAGKGDLVGCDIPLAASPGHLAVVKSSADVRALTYCFLECIHVPQLMQVLKLHTEFREQFSGDIQHDLTYNLRQVGTTSENYFYEFVMSLKYF